MPKHTWSRWTLCPAAIMTLMLFAGAGTARADILDCTVFQCFTINFSSDWLTDTTLSRTFIGTAHSTPESLDGYFNPAECFVSEGSGCFPTDPVVNMDNGDPNTQIAFTFGSPFEITIDANHLAFDLVNIDESGLPALSFDYTTPFTSDLNFDIFSCGGNAFPGCGYKLDDLELRFSQTPEPASVWLLLTAAGAAVYWRRRKSLA